LKESSEVDAVVAPEQLNDAGSVGPEFGEQEEGHADVAHVMGTLPPPPEEEATAVAVELDTLTMMDSQSAEAQVFTFGAATEEEHESTARKRRARHKRAMDFARKLRRSTRLAEKECPTYEDPSTKASRVQQARVDFSGASRRLRATLSKTHLISEPYLPIAELQALADVAMACGASEEDTAALQEEFGEPSGAE
jgi:hypothetical protein